MAFADDVKNYCNTDDDVSAYISAAEAYLANSGIDTDEDNALYALSVKMLVSAWYENRTPDPSSVNAPQPFGLTGIILQLKLAQEVANNAI